MRPPNEHTTDRLFLNPPDVSIILLDDKLEVDMIGNGRPKRPVNVEGAPLESCSKQPLTGFYRTGDCNTGPDDAGLHVVCAEMTAEFLEYSASHGNDLSTPRPGFSGLKPGDRWCLCAARWLEAYNAGVAPPVVLASTHQAALEVVPLEILRHHKL